MPGIDAGGCLSCAGRQYHFRELDMCSQPDLAVGQGIQVADLTRSISADLTRLAKHVITSGTRMKSYRNPHWPAGWFFPQAGDAARSGRWVPGCLRGRPAQLCQQTIVPVTGTGAAALIVEAGEGARDRLIIGNARQFPLRVAFTGVRSVLCMDDGCPRWYGNSVCRPVCPGEGECERAARVTCHRMKWRAVPGL